MTFDQSSQNHQNLPSNSSGEGALIIDIEGLELQGEDREIIQHESVGGLIFFARNYDCPQQMLDLTQSIREINSKIVLCVDQEGGRVQRFQAGMTCLPSFARLADAGEEACEELAFLMCREILELGIDLSFTPVLDINYGRNQVIGDRAFGSNTETVIRCARAYLKGMARAGMAPTGKHFPGHGWVELDSHVALPVDERSYEEICSQDMSVFSNLMPELSAIMTAHVLYPKIDEVIATYSRKWLDILRRDLKFKGIIISDDLGMAGAAGHGSVTVRAQAAVDAGCDVMLMCNNRSAVRELLNTENPWKTSKSLDLLRGRVGTAFQTLCDDEEYQRTHQRWQSILA